MGRNAEQLRIEAIGTGWFQGPHLFYKGDGYSIPHQAWYVPPIADTLLYAWKRYLDDNYGEYARLHDWLYTPYGQLINVTREEADAALFEELSRDDPTSAYYVNLAVEQFGGWYFGTSLTGYVFPGNGGSGSNIPFATQSTTNPFWSYAVPTKIIVLFQQTTDPQGEAPSIGYTGIPRIAGWSETYYGPDSPTEVLAILKGPRQTLRPMLEARAGIMSENCRIVGVRLYQGLTGKGSLVSATYKGVKDLQSDIPNLGLLVAASNRESGLTRRWIARGLPDVNCENGEFSPGPGIIPRIDTWFKSLSGLGWMGTSTSNLVQVRTITSGGVVTTKTPHGFAQFQVPHFKNVTVKSSGKRVSGDWKISTLNPDNTVFTIEGWTYGASEGGTVGFDSLLFQQFTNCDITVARVAVRKPGRPFVGYRGRASTRRR